MDKTLTVSLREERGKKLAGLRARGVLPAVMYGPKEKTISVSLERAAFEKLFKETGESTIITLKGLDHEMDVLVHDITHDPVSGMPLHVDFYAVEMDKTLTVHVPIEYVGESPLTKSGGAVLTKVLHEIEIECLPRNLPQHITVAVDGLTEIDAAIHVKDLAPVTGVTFLAEPEDVVCIISEVVEEAEAAPEAIDMASIEVEQKGKKEEEGESAE